MWRVAIVDQKITWKARFLGWILFISVSSRWSQTDRITETLRLGEWHRKMPHTIGLPEEKIVQKNNFLRKIIKLKESLVAYHTEHY